MEDGLEHQNSEAPTDPAAAAKAANRHRNRNRKKWRPPPEPFMTAPRVPRIEDIGAMPTDSAARMNVWVHKSLGIQLAQVLADPTLTEAERRRQHTDIARAMASLTPITQLQEAADLIRGEAAALADAPSGPAVEPSRAAQFPIDPALGRPTPRRGRPPKRSIGRS